MEDPQSMEREFIEIVLIHGSINCDRAQKERPRNASISKLAGHCDKDNVLTFVPSLKVSKYRPMSPVYGQNAESIIESQGGGGIRTHIAAAKPLRSFFESAFCPMNYKLQADA
jgi:hypothetical protein